MPILRVSIKNREKNLCHSLVHDEIYKKKKVQKCHPANGIADFADRNN